MLKDKNWLTSILPIGGSGCDRKYNDPEFSLHHPQSRLLILKCSKTCKFYFCSLNRKKGLHFKNHSLITDKNTWVARVSVNPKVLYLIRLNWKVLLEYICILGLIGEHIVSLWFIVTQLYRERKWVFWWTAVLFLRIDLGLLIENCQSVLLHFHENILGLPLPN